MMHEKKNEGKEKNRTEQKTKAKQSKYQPGNQRATKE
jgi:hypothetical protein